MKLITVNRQQLKILLDNIEELAQYIEQLVEWAYEGGKKHVKEQTK